MIHAADVWSLIPSQSGQVLKINLRNFAGSNTVQGDLVRNFFRQAGFDEKKHDPSVFCELTEEILIVTPVLAEDNTLVFVKTKVPEAVFCARMTELTGIRYTTVRAGNRTENRFILPQSGYLPGIAPKQRVIAFAFIDNNVAVFAKDSLSGYMNCKRYGLPQAKRRLLAGPRLLAVGFFEPDPGFLEKTPLFPPFRLAYYSLEILSNGSLRIKASADCPDENSANQVQMQVQQFIMVGSILLNQKAPDLTQEWISMFRVQRNKLTISLAADISASFIARLAEISRQVTESPDPGPSPARSPGKDLRN